MSNDNDPVKEGEDKALFWACFLSLIATAFYFIIRALVMDDWQAQFALNETQKGEIFGAGLWPFAISIVLFSLIIDKIGYGRAMAFAFVCHLLSILIILFANGYNMLYWGSFVGALGNGTVEAVINPVVATMFTRNKTKWLNMLHAGWPGGLVIGGLLVLILGSQSWQIKFGLALLPVIAYGILMIGKKFPVHERVTAGVSYKAMLGELGGVGAFVIVILISLELFRVFAIPTMPIALGTVTLHLIPTVLSLAIAIGFGVFVQSIGRPMFIFMMLIMFPLATTELGTDTWISDLMTAPMGQLGLAGGWVLVYTSFIMMLLRFSAGPIVERISPLGLLALSALIAALGLVALSRAEGVAILVAATLYACGKTFFWPTTLGVVAERYPKGGALTLNTIAGVGMLCVGIIGAQFLGNIQDNSIERGIHEYDTKNSTTIVDDYMHESVGILGTYMALDQEKVKEADESTVTTISSVTEASKKAALQTVAIFPVIMLIAYLILIMYFKGQGGYKALHLDEPAAVEH